MNMVQILDSLKNNQRFGENITKWVEIPEREAVYCDFPSSMDQRIKDALMKRGIKQLYSHQKSAFEKAVSGKDIVVVTPTASGKTLCFHLPVLDAVLKDPDSRALFLFPTKALAQDQMLELHDVVTEMGVDVKTYTYDGDTPQSARKAVRQAGHIVVTNPDMLHSGILPHHTKWTKLFENLKYVVIDEIHHYRGVFGSHLANVIRRLHRICRFYGSDPVFICCSATIANPKELSSKIIGRETEVVDNNGAPSGKKYLLFYNPPTVNKELGIRKSSIKEAYYLAEQFIKNDIQTIIFAQSRVRVELLATYLKSIFFGRLQQEQKIRAYRGGYLPLLRREIERGLRSGEIRGVVSTNALELGIDIGALEACIICGYPGSVASTWQQAGRAGRRNGVSVAILVADSSPLNQYIISNPDYFLQSKSENAMINPDNLTILYSHIMCAAFELPFEDGEVFGPNTLPELLKYMEEAKLLRHVQNRWYWMSEQFPANAISLRTSTNENFVIIDISDPKHSVIGETDWFSAPMLLHEEAIYIHEGNQYQVEKLDYTEKKAYVRRVDVDYYTDANLAVDLKVLEVFKEDESQTIGRYWGDVMISALVTMFKKIKLLTHENIGAGHVNLPETEMHTTAYWITFPEELERELGKEKLEDALLGLSNVLGNCAPFYLMCDVKDIRVVYHVKSVFTQKPTIYIYDNVPGGVGFSEKLFTLHKNLYQMAKDLIQKCGCTNGCPSCIGAYTEFSGSENLKDAILALINIILAEETKTVE
jgi:DEAD/DEAH box helicase domain-containing protein